MEDNRQNRDEKVAMILKYFGVIMAIFYFTMGAAVLLLPFFAALDNTIRYIFAAMLLIYGVFRLYRIFKR